MGREIRRVPMTWTVASHPGEGQYASGGRSLQPMFDCTLLEAQAEWDSQLADPSVRESTLKYLEPGQSFQQAFEEDYGPRPEEGDGGPYHPDWSGQEMGIALWETTSEGTPVSDPFPDTPDGRRELAEWAAVNATTFADFRASAQDWHRMLFDEEFVRAEDGRGNMFL